LMMQTEVGEASEPFAANRGSSSTMPQKRNPISCVYITACAASVRQSAAALLTAMDEDHERATGPWEIEWITLPSIFTLAAGALNQAVFVLKGLEVHPDRMRANLDATHGLIVSEAVMMGLARRSVATRRMILSTTFAVSRWSRIGRWRTCSPSGRRSWRTCLETRFKH
jgi:3-carboxy-cis,cis-muconate cycloisomerase